MPNKKKTFVYTYACHEDELELCKMELRVLFGADPRLGAFESAVELEVSRSPFVKMRIDVELEGQTLQELAEQAKGIELNGATFKVQYVTGSEGVSVEYGEEREIERQIGANIRGKAEMRTPEKRLGVIQLQAGRWLLGTCRTNEAMWLKHKNKPRQYSTALTTRMARAVANIAVPEPQGVRAIDPCCGIGTVMIEALSMGMNMIGCDVNPLAVQGARANLAFFGFSDVVALQDLREIEGVYDAAIVDLPYNLCSVLGDEERLELLASIRKFARRAVLITTQLIDPDVARVGFRIQDRCEVRKGGLVRQVLLCL